MENIDQNRTRTSVSEETPRENNNQTESSENHERFTDKAKEFAKDLAKDMGTDAIKDGIKGAGCMIGSTVGGYFVGTHASEDKTSDAKDKTSTLPRLTSPHIAGLAIFRTEWRDTGFEIDAMPRGLGNKDDRIGLTFQDSNGDFADYSGKIIESITFEFDADQGQFTKFTLDAKTEDIFSAEVVWTPKKAFLVFTPTIASRAGNLVGGFHATATRADVVTRVPDVLGTASVRYLDNNNEVQIDIYVLAGPVIDAVTRIPTYSK